MDGMIKVSPELLISTAGEFSNQGTTINTLTGEMLQMYQEAGVKIPTKIAGLLCSAIISDTLLFRSPTCTAVDEKIAENLAKIAGINLEEMAKVYQESDKGAADEASGLVTDVIQ